jgi:hypothetical protein
MATNSKTYAVAHFTTPLILKVLVMQSGHYSRNLVTFKKSAFCPHIVFMC